MFWQFVRHKMIERLGLSISLSLFCAACGASSASVAPEQVSSTCVEIEDGDYVFKNGVFVLLPEPKVVEAPGDMLELAKGQVSDLLTKLGYTWMSLEMSDDIVVLSGEAPDYRSKSQGYAAGVAAIRANGTMSPSVRVIVDGVSVVDTDSVVIEDEIDPVQSFEILSCQSDLNNVFVSGGVVFEATGVRLTTASQDKLDAVAEVATQCEGYDLDIASHSAANTSENFDAILAAARAESVRRYIEKQGIGAERLSVVSYGETALEAAEWTDMSPVREEIEIRFTTR